VNEVSPVQKFFGAALMAVGGLIAGLCGLCTVGVIGFGLVDTLGSGSGADDLVGGIVMVSIIGGIPTGLGVLLFLWGRNLYAPARGREDRP
jgi:hypothetical protein